MVIMNFLESTKRSITVTWKGPYTLWRRRRQEEAGLGCKDEKKNTVAEALLAAHPFFSAPVAF